VVDVPSYQTKVGDIISVKESKKKNAIFSALSGAEITMPKWVEFNTESLVGKIIANPQRDDIDMNITESLIIEKYSK
ncbi:MAG: 30S ribosomal protein S4, partial [Clostridia bacterium]|nr:30S ribosomal protein S4 [Clostridia bacterium]